MTFMTISGLIYDRKSLFGRWYRDDVDAQGHKTIEYAQLFAEGTFEFSFVSFDDKDEIIEQVTEFGDWGLVADIHFTLTKSEMIGKENYAADLNNADNYHAYKVLILDQHTFQYQHIVTDDIYTLHKIENVVGHC